jgi:hypothetical protein
MIYNSSNAMPTCSCWVVGEGEVDMVESVNTETGEARIYQKPLCFLSDDTAVMEIRKFSAIRPIFAGYPAPCMLLMFP